MFSHANDLGEILESKLMIFTADSEFREPPKISVISPSKEIIRGSID